MRACKTQTNWQFRMANALRTLRQAKASQRARETCFRSFHFNLTMGTTALELNFVPGLFVITIMHACTTHWALSVSTVIHILECTPPVVCEMIFERALRFVVVWTQFTLELDLFVLLLSSTSSSLLLVRTGDDVVYDVDIHTLHPLVYTRIYSVVYSSEWLI